MRSHADRLSSELCDYRGDFISRAYEHRCPKCRNANVVLTSTQSLQFYLICHNCGYQGPQLSLNEMRELI